MDMDFAQRITAAPRPFDPDRGADALTLVPWASGAVARVIAGTAGCSPYLAGLIGQEGDWLEGALDDPETAFADVLTQISTLALSDLPDGLRQAKRRVALLSALADVAGVWSLEQVTSTLTSLANASVDACVRRLVAAEIARGKLPGQSEDDAQTCAGYVALAMGKMGAGELNYSSDIDLICLFDDDRFDPDDLFEARASFVRVTRKMASILSDVKSGGYVFRTDLRLRPDPSVTPVCLSMNAAERYYEAVGRTWERAAHIKAAPCAGDIEAGQAYLNRLRPFVWRKHLDFAAIEDAHDMRLKIRDHKGLHGPVTLEGHNMKLGRGGIREIEFFTQTRQIIAGGRDPSLRVRGTVDGLQALTDAGWVDADVATALTDHYRHHRTIEHRLQMINDAQTHDLPSDPAGFERLAAFMDSDVNYLRGDIKARLMAVHEMTEGFFAPSDPVAEADAPNDWGKDTVEAWPGYPALRSPRATTIFNRLWPDIRAKLLDAPKPDEALAQFDGFLSGLPAGVQLFSLFEANPQLTQLIVDIAATAPALAQYLSRHSSVLDAVLGGQFFADWPGITGLKAEFAQSLSQVDDYETALITARRFVQEWHFRIGVHQLRGLIDAATSAVQYADLAEACVAALWPVVQAEFARKHGPAPGRGAVVLGMGSLGAGRLNAVSDLDLIVIYDPLDEENSDGPRPLSTRPYYARLTQALVTALSAPMSDGRLYEVDMRLRPSGRQGPVATSLKAFESYQMTDAWTWEHLALTRGRTIVGPDDVIADVMRIRSEVLRSKGQGAKVTPDVADMRNRLAAAKPAQGPWDMRNGPGRLQDLELAAQTVALQAASGIDNAIATDFEGQLRAGVAAGVLSDADARDWQAASAMMWTIHAASRLLTGTVLDPDAIGAGGREFILRQADAPDMETLLERCEKAANAIAAKIDKRMQIT